MFSAGPAGIRTTKAFSQNCRWPSLDTDRENGCIRSIEHAYSLDGGWQSCLEILQKMAVLLKQQGLMKAA